VLVAALILHVIAAVQLSRRRLVARPVGYKQGSQHEVSTLASRTIRWGGVFLLAFIVFHILHFTTLTIFPSYSTTDVYTNVVRGFSVWWVMLLYVTAMVALGFHLYHGIWSSLRTLGASKASPNPLRRPAVAALAIVVWLGFTVIPLAVFAGLVGPRPVQRPTAAPTAATGAPARAGE
jgi:succinate dehydrogenase / fumarate reductase cytochrome b subunit